jgi:hypothetical protein
VPAGMAAARAKPSLLRDREPALPLDANPASDALAKQAAQPSARAGDAHCAPLESVHDARARYSVPAAPALLEGSCAAACRDRGRRPTPLARQKERTRLRENCRSQGARAPGGRRHKVIHGPPIELAHRPRNAPPKVHRKHFAMLPHPEDGVATLR